MRKERFDGAGVAHIVEAAGHPRRVKPLPFLSDNGIPVSTSTDGGLSWSQPKYLAPIPREAETLGNSSPSVTADRTRSGVAYAVWQQLGPPPTLAGLGFSMTTDHGKTWSSQRVIYDHPSAAPLGAEVSVLPDGTLICTWVQIPAETQLPLPSEDLRGPIRAIRSTDGGKTWSSAIDIGSAPLRNPSDPETRVEVREVPSPRPAVTLDGTLHLVWTSVERERSSPLIYSRSGDGGRSFSAPRAIVDDPWQHFGPSLAATSNGTLGLTYYDTRNDRWGDGEFTTDVWFRHSHDGGETWTREIHVAGPFDADTAPQSENVAGFSGRFFGEYHGLAALPDGFAYAFTVAKPVARIGPTDIFFAQLRTTQNRTTQSRRCLARRSPIGPRNIGRIRLGYTRLRLLRVSVPPLRRTRYSYRYCIKGGGGRVSAVFSGRSKRARVELVTTTAPGHGNRRVYVRSSAAKFRRAYPNRRRLGRDLYRASRRSPLIIGLRRGRVRVIALANRRLPQNRRALRRALRRAGVSPR